MGNKYFKIEALTSLVGNDPVIIRSMLIKLIEGAKQKHLMINDNYFQGNWKQVRDNAHFLKSNFRYMGSEELTELLRTIENTVLDIDDKTEIKNLLDSFNLVFPDAIGEVEFYLAK